MQFYLKKLVYSAVIGGLIVTGTNVYSQEIHETNTGAQFIRDFSMPALGEAYRDPSGLIWGEAVKDESDKLLKVSAQQAIAYCENIGFRLPTQLEASRFAEYAGDYLSSVDNYPRRGNYWPCSVDENYLDQLKCTQIIPNLFGFIEARGLRVQTNRFWTSTINTNITSVNSTWYETMNGNTGSLMAPTISPNAHVSIEHSMNPFRCVSQSK